MEFVAPSMFLYRGLQFYDGINILKRFKHTRKFLSKISGCSRLFEENSWRRACM
jgi:hypothetical protein